MLWTNRKSALQASWRPTVPGAQQAGQSPAVQHGSMRGTATLCPLAQVFPSRVTDNLRHPGCLTSVLHLPFKIPPDSLHETGCLSVALQTRPVRTANDEIVVEQMLGRAVELSSSPLWDRCRAGVCSSASLHEASIRLLRLEPRKGAFRTS